MATRRPGVRAFRPSSEGLETRQLLSNTITGTDLDGDTWELRLTGPGDVSVVQQPDASGTAVPLGTPGLIQAILFAGTDPTESRLVGTVQKSAGGDGKVFFEQMQEFNGTAVACVLAAGHPRHRHARFLARPHQHHRYHRRHPGGPILIPDGVNTLRFGGADMTFTPPGGTPLNQNGRSDELVVALGLPYSYGTSIIIDRSISDAQAGTGTAAATQDGVQFSTIGRVNTFQANEIVGNADLPPTPLAQIGGTQLFSSGGQEANAVASFEGQVVGQFGYIRIGGDATNFTVETDSRISNFYIGGETDTILLVAPTGSRNLYFGKGMDNVEILTHNIMTLLANRGAIGSTVLSERPIGQMSFGGDVVNTQVLSGYSLLLNRVFLSQTLPTFPPPVIAGGEINSVQVAGDVVDSIFAASVAPVDGVFGNADDLVLPVSKVNGKVEGVINNTNTLPDTPDAAFFAKTTHVLHGPVVPPTVVEPPFPFPGAKPSGPRVADVLLPSDPTRRQYFPNQIHQQAATTTTSAQAVPTRSPSVFNSSASASAAARLAARRNADSRPGERTPERSKGSSGSGSDRSHSAQFTTHARRRGHHGLASGRAVRSRPVPPRRTRRRQPWESGIGLNVDAGERRGGRELSDESPATPTARRRMPVRSVLEADKGHSARRRQTSILPKRASGT